jgi:hypothetical protein
VLSLSSLLCLSCGVLDLLRGQESPSIYRRRLEECPRNIPLLTPKTDLHSVSRYTESGSTRHNRLGHVGLDQLAEDGPEQQWQGRAPPGVPSPLPCFALWALGWAWVLSPGCVGPFVHVGLGFFLSSCSALDRI